MYMCQTVLATRLSLQPSTTPAGLSNHGATCYLNSVLQALFSISAIRDQVLIDKNLEFFIALYISLELH